jgi:hypothetical protein
MTMTGTKLVVVGLLAALGAVGCAGCGRTLASTALDDKRVEKAPAASAESFDANLAQEGERWMVEQAKRRAHEPPASPAKQGATGAAVPANATTSR